MKCHSEKFQRMNFSKAFTSNLFPQVMPSEIFYPLPQPFITHKTFPLDLAISYYDKNEIFLHSVGDIETTVHPFANKWQTKESCDFLSDKIVPHPCQVNVGSKARAEIICSKLRDKIFEDCHWIVDPEQYYEDCMYDVCACKGDMDKCFCPIFASYATECARQGSVSVALRPESVAYHSWDFSFFCRSSNGVSNFPSAVNNVFLYLICKWNLMHFKSSFNSFFFHSLAHQLWGLSVAISCPNGQVFEQCGEACTRTCTDLQSEAPCKWVFARYTVLIKKIPFFLSSLENCLRIWKLTNHFSHLDCYVLKDADAHQDKCLMTIMNVSW